MRCAKLLVSENNFFKQKYKLLFIGQIYLVVLFSFQLVDFVFLSTSLVICGCSVRASLQYDDLGLVLEKAVVLIKQEI